ncbi:6-carboxytetrahydropterin synthase [Bdellovibrio sp. NC01]|uniref:6-pyruvoyl trahydropterin synthase family protein n=1 Tax=Bdellovibrio sp. NC01 TaxID=2220073 RepID=UPI001159E019|nr:6-carboxytetrahydropterin synthase [Bdellovibrio sp. NC01]QDK37680.1 6-pyruvoyl tetrahydropterin synthase [Bdellovibrio sp. NC01]
MSTITLHLAKQNFKFSAAHFLIFDEKHAERLHGHNYQVQVDIVAPQSTDDHSEGYFMDFNVFKKFIKAKLDSWDEIVLLPAKHPDMKFNKTDKSLEVTFRDRFYVFPLNEVILLPVTNTSVENLSRLLAEEFFAEFKKYKVPEIKVLVEETQGQGASTVVKA